MLQPNRRILSAIEEAQAELNRRKLQATEATILALLLRRRAQIIADGVKRGYSPARIAIELRRAMQAALLEVRRLSRVAGRARLAHELLSHGYEIRTDASLQSLAFDSLRADIVANSYARRWLKAAEAEQARDREKKAAIVAAAAAALTGRALERIAATENSQAFTSERDIAARELELETWGKVWDATLDINTCPVCYDANGTVVALDEQFPLGAPGDIHPGCRCDWSLVRIH